MIGDPNAYVAFVTLAALEIVLGVDNLIFLAVLVGRLPPHQQQAARRGGLILAMVTRIALLYSIVWLTRLTQPWLELAGRAFSARDVVLLSGGLFLTAKSVLEIHHSLEGARAAPGAPRRRAGVALTILQIGLIDIVFSLDSVFTAVGLARDFTIMAAAIVVAILTMMWVSRPIGAFIERHPTIKVLALSFLILIGVALVAESLHFEIPKGYLYFAMAFSVGVELINVRVRRR
ncbi:MAG TPA: TerC family protein [Steroidobacteraceae bacterium]|nr:TerC family protein [Steroidobacteraceae bacterium]